ncbi:Glycine betaine/proline betaine-binding periplasmic protein [subsurface metagenome]
MMKKLLVLLVVLLVVSTAVSCSPQVAPVPAELKLAAAVGDWAELPKRVTRILLEDELDCVVMVREAAADTAYAALAEGELDIFTDVWHPNHESYTDEFVPHQVKIAGDLADLTTGIYTGADQGWLVPKWTRDNYNIDSLDDIAALEPGDTLFDALDLDGDGLMDLIGGEVGWAVVEINDEKVDYYNKNYDLDMRQVVASLPGSHNEMLATIKSKLDAQEDVLFYLWTPHHLFAEYADALCDEEGQILWLTDPWGFFSEPEGTDYYTGFPGATIYIAYHAGLENEHPNVVKLLERISMTIADLNAYCYWESVVKDGEATVEEKSEYARQWIEDHRAEVNSWLTDL